MSAAIKKTRKMRSVCCSKTYFGAECFSSNYEFYIVHSPNVVLCSSGPNFFKSGRTNIHDEERSGRPSVVINNNLGKETDEKVSEN